MATVKYIGPSRALPNDEDALGDAQVADTGQWVWANEPVEVPDALAGRAPRGLPGDEDYDPGEGLLAQTGNWSSPGSSGPKVAEVLADVGDDPTRAAAALAIERTRADGGRKTLVAQLETIASKESTTDA